MSNLSVGQVILDAQRVASRVKDLDALGSALLVEAEGNNRLVESLRQFQDDLESLNRISNNKSNADIINRIQQQNAHSSELLKENRELKICLEDYEYAMELIMQKYREHANNKVLDSKLNFRELYNEKLWHIIRQQREKINEMAAVMQRAASIDDESFTQELETMSHLRLENKTLRELLQISKQAGSAFIPIRLKDHLLIDQSVQTETEELCDELSISINSIENANNNTVIQNDVNSITTTTTAIATNTYSNTATTTTATNADVIVDVVTAACELELSQENNNIVPQIMATNIGDNINCVMEKAQLSNDVASSASHAPVTTAATTTTNVNTNDQALIKSAT